MLLYHLIYNIIELEQRSRSLSKMMFGHVGCAGPPEPHGHASINHGWTLLIFIFDHHHCLSCPLPRLSEALKASKKVSNWFYDTLHALLTSHPAYRYPQTLVDDSTSYQHPTSFRGLWVIYGLSRALPCDEEKPPPASPLVGM